jgi:hypothetical protein
MTIHALGNTILPSEQEFPSAVELAAQLNNNNKWRVSCGVAPQSGQLFNTVGSSLVGSIAHQFFAVPSA